MWHEESADLDAIFRRSAFHSFFEQTEKRMFEKKKKRTRFTQSSLRLQARFLSHTFDTCSDFQTTHFLSLKRRLCLTKAKKHR